MHNLIKVINKFNGNLCFVGATDAGDIIFECDRYARTLSYVSSGKLITDVCVRDENSYFVTFGDEWIGLFEDGVLDENYIRVDFDNIDRILSNSQGEYYALDKTNNVLIKFEALTPHSSSSSSSSSSLDSSSSSSSSSSISSSSSSSLDSSSSSSSSSSWQFSSNSSSSSSSSSTGCCVNGWVSNPATEPVLTDWYIPGANETLLPGCIWDVTVNVAGFPTIVLTGNARGTASTWTATGTAATPSVTVVSITYSDASVAVGSATYNGDITFPPLSFELSCFDFSSSSSSQSL